MSETRNGRIYIVDTPCCGTNCMKIVDKANWTVVGYGSDHDDPEYFAARQGKPKNKKRLAALWRVKYRALLAALKQAVDGGSITQEEADDLLKQWLEANPDPEAPIEVTKELEAIGQPIPVVIPGRVEQDQQ